MHLYIVFTPECPGTYMQIYSQPFAKVSQKDIEHFTSILGSEGIVTDGAVIMP